MIRRVFFVAVDSEPMAVDGYRLQSAMWKN